MSQADLVAVRPVTGSPDVMGLRDLIQVDVMARFPFVPSPDVVAYRDNHVSFPSSVTLPPILGELALTLALPTFALTGTGPSAAASVFIPRIRGSRSGRGRRR